LDDEGRMAQVMDLDFSLIGLHGVSHEKNREK
jgi:hypothetical protein